jgi:4-amino-4-deoxy-L-arabinose transferase-like glycosyltransferase
MTSSPLLVVVGYVLLSVLSAAILVGYLRHHDTPKDAFAVLLGAYLVRLAYATIDGRLGILAGRYDFVKFDRALWLVAQGWRSGDFLTALTFHDGFYVLYTSVYAPVYVVFGHEPILVRVVVALIGTLFVFNVYRIGRLVGNHRAGLFAAAFSAVFPYWIYLSGIFYRDILVMLLLSQALYLMLYWNHTEGVNRTVVYPLFFAALAVSLRYENVAPLTAGLAAAIAFKFDRSKWPYVAATSAVATIAGVTVYLWIRSAPLTVGGLAKRRLFLARETAGGAYLVGNAYDNLVEMVAFLPVGAAYFLLVPFPWQAHNLLAILANVQNLLWYPVVLMAVPGIRVLYQRNAGDLAILLGFVLVGVASYGLVEGNIGPAMRHRSQFQFPIVVLAALALENRVRFHVSSPDGGARTATS